LVDIVKVDGRREPFVREKVTVSALKSGAPPEEARAIGEAVERVAYDGMPSGGDTGGGCLSSSATGTLSGKKTGSCTTVL